MGDRATQIAVSIRFPVEEIGKYPQDMPSLSTGIKTA
jgi:hypothetical protein